MNILLVEDDTISSTAIFKQLSEKGHIVHLAENGKKAVDIVLDHPVDLVVCDLMLPVISGVSFLRIRDKFMSPSVPVIAMSVLDDAEEILKNLGVEFGYFIKKPVEFQILLNIIQQIKH